MDLGLITAASQSVSVIKTLAEGLVSIRDETKLQLLRIDLLQKIGDLQGTIFDLRQQQSEQFEQHQQTKRELDEAKRKLAERDQFVLHQAAPGAFVYATTKDATGTYVEPFYCQTCHDAGKKSILRFLPESQYEPAYYRCAINSAHLLQLGPDKAMPQDNHHPFRDGPAF